MTRVLHVIENFNGQAVESWLTRLVTYEDFDSSRLHFDFFLLGEGPGRYACTVLDMVCRVHLGNPGGASIPQMARALRRHVQAGTYDIVHIHQDVLAGIFALALVGTGVKLVTHVHNCWQRLPVGGYWKERVLTALARQLALKLSRAVVGVSGQALIKMTGGTPRNNRADLVIYCSAKSSVQALSEGDQKRIAAEVRQQYGLPPVAQLLLFLGRLDEYKNPLFALAVLQEMVMRGNQDVFLVLAGVGGLADQVRSLAAQHGLRDRIRLVGWVDDPAPLLLASDLLLMPSQEWCGEGLGLAAVEAQGCGVPVLCSLSIPTDAAVIPDLFRRLSLRDGLGSWASSTAELLGQVRPGISFSRARLEQSAFTVAASYLAVSELYASIAPALISPATDL